MHIFSLYLDECVFQSEYVMYRCDQMYGNLVKSDFTSAQYIVCGDEV